jgi:putative protease
MRPEKAVSRELTAAAFATQLHKTGGTPFYCAGVKSSIEPGLSLPTSAINELRREVLNRLLEQRRALPAAAGAGICPPLAVENRIAEPVINVQLMRARQLSRELFDLKPRILYFPLEELHEAGRELWPFLDSPEVTVCAVLPRIVHDQELDDVSAMLRRASGMGIREVRRETLG